MAKRGVMLHAFGQLGGIINCGDLSNWSAGCLPLCYFLFYGEHRYRQDYLL